MSEREPPGRWPALLAFVLSFAVYALPILLPHVIVPWGTLLWSELTGPAAAVPEARIFVLLAAVAIQLIVAGLLCWLFRRPRWWSIAAFVVAVPVVFATVEWLYLGVFPGWLYVARDTTPERATWPVECEIAAADVAMVQSPTSLALERAGEGWLRRGSERPQYALLTLPGCHVRDLTLDASSSMPFVVPGGRAVSRPMTGQTSMLLRDGSPEPLAPPPGHTRDDAGPILSNDGAWAVWVVREPPPLSLFARHLTDGQELRVSLAAVDVGGIEPLEVDMAEREVVVRRGGGEIFVLGLDGTIRGRVNPAPLLFVNGFRRVADGWVAWGTSRDDDPAASGPSTIAWSLAGGAGRHEVLPGRALESVAVQPAGRFVAVSVVQSIRVGRAVSSVYVLELPSGAEVFRRYFPDRYASTCVAFAGNDHLAYAEGGAVRVLRVPD